MCGGVFFGRILNLGCTRFSTTDVGHKSGTQPTDWEYLHQCSENFIALKCPVFGGFQEVDAASENKFFRDVGWAGL
jgi:hypothetical protein